MTKADKLAAAFDAGLKAAQDGKSKSGNVPAHLSTSEASAWLRGFDGGLLELTRMGKVK